MWIVGKCSNLVQYSNCVLSWLILQIPKWNKLHPIQLFFTTESLLVKGYHGLSINNKTEEKKWQLCVTILLCVTNRKYKKKINTKTKMVKHVTVKPNQLNDQCYLLLLLLILLLLSPFEWTCGLNIFFSRWRKLFKHLVFFTQKINWW